MRCPLCDVAMREVERRGVRIDVCPECRGVWLDRGELEKLLAAEPDVGWEERRPADDGGGYDEQRRYGGERRYGDVRRHDDERRYDERRYDERPYDDDRPYDDEPRHREGYKRKKKGWLSELFDFDFFD